MSWPQGLAPVGAPGWEREAVNWLFDRCPGEYRSYEIFRSHPELLAHIAIKHLDRQIEAVRDAYRGARMENNVEASVLNDYLQALEKEGARLALELPSAQSVCDALVSSSSG